MLERICPHVLQVSVTSSPGFTRRIASSSKSHADGPECSYPLTRQMRRQACRRRGVMYPHRGRALYLVICRRHPVEKAGQRESHLVAVNPETNERLPSGLDEPSGERRVGAERAVCVHCSGD